jgi:hypothetical protein
MEILGLQPLSWLSPGSPLNKNVNILRTTYYIYLILIFLETKINNEEHENWSLTQPVVTTLLIFLISEIRIAVYTCEIEKG